MKNIILLICLILTVLTLTFCANPDTVVDLNCPQLEDPEGTFGGCGVFPVPSKNDEPIDFCFHSDSIVADADTASNNVDYIIETLRGNVPIIAAPHGSHDTGTKDIAIQIGEDLIYNSLVFYRFRTLLDLNVNRPTTGAHQAMANEKWDYDAASVYHCYRQHLLSMLTPNSDQFMVEIHGNDLQASEDRLEIVCSDDITNNEDAQIKAIFNDEIQDEYGGQNPFHAITLGQDGNTLNFTASATRTCGIFCVMQQEDVPAIHIEIPLKYRGGFDTPERETLINMMDSAISRIENEVF